MCAMKVLQVGPYPIQPRIHGGQRRVGALHDAYLRHGIDCRYVCVYNAASYPHGRGQNLIHVGKKTQRAIHQNGWLQDLLVGQGLEDDPQTRDRFVRIWRAFRPHVVQLEQPFTWPAIQRLLASGVVPPAQVIYSSQNVEWVMKEGIYAQVLPAHEAEAATRHVREMEVDLAKQADLVVAVSQTDADVYTQVGARRVLVVRNGCQPRTPTPRALASWRRHLVRAGIRRYAAFVSSAHLPNLTGFDVMLGPSLDYVPPEAKIVVCGQGARHLATFPSYDPVHSNNRWRLELLLDPVDDNDLAAILHLAHAILLPIQDGGGSNLKTVEAVLTGRPIIATPYAFRSFEELAGRPGIRLCREPREFRQSVRDTLLASDEPLTVSSSADEALHELTWTALGDRFVAGVRDVLATESWTKEVA